MGVPIIPNLEMVIKASQPVCTGCNHDSWHVIFIIVNCERIERAITRKKPYKLYVDIRWFEKAHCTDTDENKRLFILSSFFGRAILLHRNKTWSILCEFSEHTSPVSLVIRPTPILEKGG